MILKCRQNTHISTEFSVEPCRNRSKSCEMKIFWMELMTLRVVNKWHQFVIIVVVNRVPRLRLSMVLNNSDQTCCTSIVMKRNKMFRLILTDFALNGVFKTIYFANFKISRNTIVLDSSAYCTSLWNNQMFEFQLWKYHVFIRKKKEVQS